MIRSMTGYGDAEAAFPGGVLRLEVKSVNHRYFNVQLRTPQALESRQSWIQDRLKGHVSRGHLNVTLRLDVDDEEAGSDLPRLDLEKALHYQSLLARLQRELGLPGEVEVSDLVRFRDIFTDPEPVTEPPEVPEEVLADVIDRAGEALVRMREEEGARLQSDLEGRLDALEGHLDRVEERAPVRLVEERDRLRSQIRELVDSDDVDEERLAREVAYLAEKWDINEEVVRFRAHLSHFRDLIDAPSPEPAGKRLGFVVQEMHREANTIGAKANDSGITQAVVGLKEEIERLREQVDNVE